MLNTRWPTVFVLRVRFASIFFAGTLDAVCQLAASSCVIRFVPKGIEFGPHDCRQIVAQLYVYPYFRQNVRRLNHPDVLQM